MGFEDLNVPALSELERTAWRLGTGINLLNTKINILKVSC